MTIFEKLKGSELEFENKRGVIKVVKLKEIDLSFHANGGIKNYKYLEC